MSPPLARKEFVMSFVTQGKIKVSLGTDTKVKVSPTNEYRVTHRKETYTVFIDGLQARCFKDDHLFEVDDATILRYLVEVAVKDICLEITIEDPPSSKITHIQVPA
jgi:hypothetical protein